MQNVTKLVGLDLRQTLPSGLQLFEGFHERLGHAAVRFLRAADDGKLLPGRHALVTVRVVEADSEQSGFTFFRIRWFLGTLFTHAGTVSTMAGVSSEFSSTAVQTISEND